MIRARVRSDILATSCSLVLGAVCACCSFFFSFSRASFSARSLASRSWNVRAWWNMRVAQPYLQNI